MTTQKLKSIDMPTLANTTFVFPNSAKTLAEVKHPEELKEATIVFLDDAGTAQSPISAKTLFDLPMKAHGLIEDVRKECGEVGAKYIELFIKYSRTVRAQSRMCSA